MLCILFEKRDGFNFCLITNGLYAFSANTVGDARYQLRLQTLGTVLFIIKGAGVRLRKTMGGAIAMGALALHIGKLELLTAIGKGTAGNWHCWKCKMVEHKILQAITHISIFLRSKIEICLLNVA